MAEERAQATVEMAVVTPVLIVLALIVLNLMTYLSATARFDRVVPDIVIATAVSPDGEDGSTATLTDAIAERVTDAMDGYEVEVTVEKQVGGATGGDELVALVGQLETYVCTMRMRPWPSRFSIAGLDLGAPAVLSHTRSVTIDPWRPGVVA